MKKFIGLLVLSLVLSACAQESSDSSSSAPSEPPAVVEPPVVEPPVVEPCQSQEDFDILADQAEELSQQILETNVAIVTLEATIENNQNWLANPPAHASAAATRSHQNLLATAQSDLAVQQLLLQSQQAQLDAVLEGLELAICQ